MEELADLHRRDIFYDTGVWAIRLVESKDETTGVRRRLKTANAARVVPLHPEILKIGFLNYVQRVTRDASAPLFPDLAPQGKDGRRGPRMTRWFVEYRRAIGVYRDGVGMHSFRHTVITRLSNVISGWKQERHRDFMMGHSDGGSEGTMRYDKGPGLVEAAATLSLLTYPELDFSRLYV